MGFSAIVLPSRNAAKLKDLGIKVTGVDSLADAIKMISSQ
jgi:hypothetical protein